MLALAVAAPLLAQTAQTTQTAPAAERPASAGVYTEAQAAEGETVYRAACSACHVPSDQSGPQFKLNWVGRTVWEYWAGLKKTMPEDNVGGLSNDEYTRVVAYILRLNGYPAGADSLSSDSTSLKLIRIAPLAGDAAKPLTRR